MRVVIVGLGIQGRKRLAVAGADVVATIDPVEPSARYRAIEEVPRTAFDAACVCTPDAAKLGILECLLSAGKHVLVEKPLLASEETQISRLADLARAAGVACYTAYNHRFEPNLVRLKEVIASGVLGSVYLARFFYGNGTARDVRQSPWRDQGLGVVPDLGSHLLDLVLFLFGRPTGAFEIWSLSRFENRAYDHMLGGFKGTPTLVLEGTLLSWRNTFAVDVLGERGSAHVQGLCKWGPSSLAVRRRVLPSGKPDEDAHVIKQADPTWRAEYEHFKALCRTGGTNLENDVWIVSVLNQIARAVGEASIP